MAYPKLEVGKRYSYTWDVPYPDGTFSTSYFTVTGENKIYYYVSYSNGCNSFFSKTSPVHAGSKPG